MHPFISVQEITATRSNIHYRTACTASRLPLQSLIYCQANAGPRKLRLVILSAQDPAFLWAAISCTGNQYEGAVRRVNSTQEPRYTITLISVCLQTEYQLKVFLLFAVQVEHYYMHG